jgi:sterol carrier protein 2
MKEHKLEDQAVEIVGIALTTDTNKTFDTKSLMDIAGYDMSKRAADEVYNKTKVCPRQIGVVELHDCFSANELITYEALGLCPEGKAGEFIDSGSNTYGGRVVVNVTIVYNNPSLLED